MAVYFGFALEKELKTTTLCCIRSTESECLAVLEQRYGGYPKIAINMLQPGSGINEDMMKWLMANGVDLLEAESASMEILTQVMYILRHLRKTQGGSHAGTDKSEE